MPIEHRTYPSPSGDLSRLTVTVECSACGAVNGQDYQHFAKHLRYDHDPEDFGLAPRWDEEENPDERDESGDPAEVVA